MLLKKPEVYAYSEDNLNDEDDEDEDELEMISKSDVFLSGAFLSSALANDQCQTSLPRTTQAHPDARNYKFTSASYVFGGSPPSTTCSATNQKISEHTSVKSADACASTCASEDTRSNIDELLGYNYNCHTKKCDCIRGHGSLTTKPKLSGSYWACYKSDTVITPPTPTPPPPPPTPAQCLPVTVTGTGGGSTATFTRVAPQYRHTTCNVGTAFLPVPANSVEECANNCAAKTFGVGGQMGGKKLIGFDYDCDSTDCTCLTGNGGTNLSNNIQTVNDNMACYSISSAQMDAKKNLRAN